MGIDVSDYMGPVVLVKVPCELPEGMMDPSLFCEEELGESLVADSPMEGKEEDDDGFYQYALMPCDGEKYNFLDELDDDVSTILLLDQPIRTDEFAHEFVGEIAKLVDHYGGSNVSVVVAFVRECS